MKVNETKLKGCFLITPQVIKDERGCFFESFNKRNFENLTNIKTNFVQDNQSKSSKGVLRGLHFQIKDYAQAKLVSVIHGRVMDVAVDLRPNSKTFGNHISVVLDAKSHKQLYIPRGFAHGFLALENDTIFSYKCDNYYNKDYERGIIYNDKLLNINWKFPSKKLIISKKDQGLLTFKEYLDE